jgi:hypothetical protein
MDHVSIGRWFGDSNYENPDRLSTYRLQHYPPLTPVLSYRGDNFARKNQEALLQLQAYADSIHAKLLVALLSAQKNHNAEVCDFLQEHSINFIDIGDEGYNFNDKHLSWRIDSHANEEGNEVIADALYRFIQPALGSDSRKFESPTN